MIRFPIAFWRSRPLFANILLFVVLFSISVGIRTDNMQTPIGRGHEWVTGHVLLTLSIYQQGGGPSNYLFAPVLDFSKPAEKFLMSGNKFKDKNGHGYYVSYPPFGFLAPYYAFKLVGAVATVRAIRCFGIFIHLLCSFLILLVVLEFYGKSIRETIFLPAFLASAVYMFASGNLWFHSNIYFVDCLVPVFIIGVLLVIVKFLRHPEKLGSVRLLLLLGVLNFLGSYTEWLQVFFAFTICVFAFVAGFRNRKYFRLWAVMVVSTLLPVALTIWQYTSIAGFAELEKQSVEKYNQRSGRAEKPDYQTAFLSTDSILKLTANYEKQYKHVLDFCYFSILLLVAFFLFRRNRMELLKESMHIWLPLLLLVLALLMHLLVFYNFNVVHDFGTLKCSIFFALLIGVAFGALRRQIRYYHKATRFIAYAITLGFFGYTISESVNRYYRNNNSNQVTSFDVNLGTMARIYAAPDEIVFASTINPVTSYCAQRNIVDARNPKHAIDILQYAKYDKGIYIDVEDNEIGKVRKVVRITRNGDSTILVRDFIPPRIDP